MWRRHALQGARASRRLWCSLSWLLAPTQPAFCSKCARGHRSKNQPTQCWTCGDVEFAWCECRGGGRMQLRFTSDVGYGFLQILLGRKRRQLLYLLHYVSAVLDKL
jgi:hypothetical protein